MSVHNTPRVSTTHSIGQSLRQSLILKRKKEPLDRSYNESQNTDRSMSQSPRVLNSQSIAYRSHNNSNIVPKSLRQSMNETRSFLDTSHNQLIINSRKSQNSTAFASKRQSHNPKTSFGLSFYKMPNCQYYNDSVLFSKFLPGKRDHFLAKHCKNKSMIPSPDRYETRGNLLMENPKKRLFSKLPRLTMAAEILKKGSSTPGPGSYRPGQFKKKKHSHKATDRRDLGLISEAI
jgi:hypothetical protein